MKDLRIVIIVIALCGIVACKKTPTAPDPDPELEKKGTLSGQITGEFQGGIITSGKVSLPNTSYSADIQSDGNFNIPEIINPTNYKRIRITSDDGIDRETNISLNEGDNTANITMIENDSVTGYFYEDYLTINRSGNKMDSGQNYQVYFYDKSVWDYNDGVWSVVGTSSDIYADDAIAKCMDVLQNDLPRLSKGAYSYNGIILESNDLLGRGDTNIPTVHHNNV